MEGCRLLVLFFLTCLQSARADENVIPFSTFLDNGSKNQESDVYNTDGRPHIVGGVEVKPHSHPHQVGLELESFGGDGFCAGSLISDKWVITAAHCVDSRMNITAMFGVHDYGANESTIQSVVVEEIVVHPNWNRKAMHNDIALLKLNNSVHIDGTRVDIIRLPRVSQRNWSFWNYQATMTGWGRDKDGDFPDMSSPSVLRSTTSRVVTNFYCTILYFFISIPVRGENICTSGWWAKGTCHGDSGGPLITQESDGQRMLIGITSFGYPKCQASWPSVFTRITSYLDWIHNTTGIAPRP